MDNKSIKNPLPALVFSILFFVAGMVLFILYFIPFGIASVTISLILSFVALGVNSQNLSIVKEEADVAVKEAQSELLEYVNIKKEKTELGEKISSLSNENESLKADVMKKTEEIRVANEKLDSKSQSLSTLLPPSGESKVINIIDSARDVVTELSPFAKKVGIAIMLSTSSESIFVKADPKLIKIMFRNIVDNSIKYMNSTGSLVITISSIGEDLFIVLKDNGNGLSESEADHIFELNFQGSNRVSGNGLGLTQSKAIVENYGGTIYAKTGNNKGMAIYIQLPASKL